MDVYGFPYGMNSLCLLAICSQIAVNIIVLCYIILCSVHSCCLNLCCAMLYHAYGGMVVVIGA